MKAHRISEAEWEVMEVIWQKSPITSAETIAVLVKERAWAANTVRTMLSRLVKKKALCYRHEGNRYLYRPTIPRDSCVKSEVDSLLHRLFGGATQPLLMHFVRNKKLSATDIANLRKILDEKEDAS